MAITENEKKVQLYAEPSVVRAFRDFYEALGMKQNEAGTRLFRWFMEQPEIVRRQILTPMPDEYAPDVARLVLERMVATEPAEGDMAQRAREAARRAGSAARKAQNRETPRERRA